MSGPARKVLPKSRYDYRVVHCKGEPLIGAGFVRHAGMHSQKAALFQNSRDTKIPRGFTMTERTCIYQIYYAAAQVSSLDADFIPYSNVENPRPEWCEYHVFRKEYPRGTCASGINGFVSWKFGQKTRLPGAGFLNWIEQNPGHDVFVVNPFPKLASPKYQSVWHHGEASHPGIIRITQSLFDRVGYDIDISALRMATEKIAFCNYWAGTADFWHRYMAFCGPIHDLIEHGLGDDEKRSILQTADPVSGTCFIPYIFERLFSTLLTVDPAIRVCQMPVPSKERLSWGRWLRRELHRPYRRMLERRQTARRSA